ncbi:unnamed protein product, partial [Staurois parvus]
MLFISTDHCIGVTGDVSDTKSVALSVKMPATVRKYRYKSLITLVVKKKKNSSIYTAKCYNFHVNQKS